VKTEATAIVPDDAPFTVTAAEFVFNPNDDTLKLTVGFQKKGTEDLYVASPMIVCDSISYEYS